MRRIIRGGEAGSDARKKGFVRFAYWRPTEYTLRVLAKIAAVLPADLRDDFDASALLVGPSEPIPSGNVELALIQNPGCLFNA